LDTFVGGRDGDGDPVTEDTAFLVGSVAKTFTAAAVLQLVDQGRVRLDDLVTTYVPWLNRVDATVRQLLTHTSGFTAADGMAVSERYDNRPGALGSAARDLEMSGRPGRLAYSSADYLVLGALVEEVTGRDFGEHLEDRVLAPLGMRQTAATASSAADLPPGHRLWWGTPRTYDPGFDESGAPYGYVVSTLDDLVVWARAQLDGRVVGGELGEEQRTVQAPSGEGGGYGLGWRITPDGAGTAVHHTGATPGYFAHVLLRPGQERAVVVLANGYAEAQAPSLASAAFDLLDIVDGRPRTPTGGDPLLTVAPWLFLGLAVIGLAVAAVARRLPWRRRLRRAAAVPAVVLVVVLAYLPGLTGYAPRTLWTWLPDGAVSLVACATAWTLATVSLLVPARLRGPRGC
jgi:CubicO group peptidase (beta-lactamase class C family)